MTLESGRSSATISLSAWMINLPEYRRKCDSFARDRPEGESRERFSHSDHARPIWQDTDDPPYWVSKCPRSNSDTVPLSLHGESAKRSASGRLGDHLASFWTVPRKEPRNRRSRCGSLDRRPAESPRSCRCRSIDQSKVQACDLHFA